MSNKFNPESELEKHGWTAGSGLGRGEDGIKEAIKVKLKFDQTGVGHNPGEQFTYHWWDHVYNKAANNISVENSEDKVKVKATGECNISSKKGKTDTSNMLYGRFVKAATLTSEGLEVQENKVKSEKSKCSSDDSSSDSDSNDEDIGTASKLTDDQLLKICGGRTAHKAARHGHGLNGKLARIAQQESGYSSTNATPCASPKSSPKSTVQSDPVETMLKTDPVTSEASDTNKSDPRKKRKKKKKSKQKDANEDDNDNDACTVLNESIEHSEKSPSDCDISSKKSRKKSKRQTELVNIDEENEINDECSKKPKKKKRKAIDIPVDEPEINHNSESSTKKKKKKHKKNKQ